MFENKRVLITGGTGSFGQTMVSYFLNTDVDEIYVFSRDELKQEQLRTELSKQKVKFIIGDVRDRESLLTAMRGVDFVFHAAALKQVPSCEFHPTEALKTNVLGTENVLEAATISKVRKVVMLSTDKAVYPINAMGISKAFAEKIMVSKARNQQRGQTVFCATRYGNVMASRGSVIPLFLSQLKSGKAITVTDPSMTRFLMSLQDAVSLVLEAFKHGDQGDIFVQKAPACTLGDLIVALKELFQKTEHPVKVIGTRHGEKVFESLISREEMTHAEDFGEYVRIRADKRSLNYENFFSEGDLNVSNQADFTSHNAERLNVKELKSLLLSLDIVKESLNG
jgi:UDP-N-acetylglucosamine 4,6-dehydratase